MNTTIQRLKEMITGLAKRILMITYAMPPPRYSRHAGHFMAVIGIILLPYIIQEANRAQNAAKPSSFFFIEPPVIKNSHDAPRRHIGPAAELPLRAPSRKPRHRRTHSLAPARAYAMPPG